MTVGGSIVNVGSVASLIGYHSVAYTASKWALRGSLAWPRSSTAPVDPGEPRQSRIRRDADTGRCAPAYLQVSLDLTPAGRLGTPDDVASLVLFLLSDPPTT